MKLWWNWKQLYNRNIQQQDSFQGEAFDAPAFKNSKAILYISGANVSHKTFYIPCSFSPPFSADFPHFPSLLSYISRVSVYWAKHFNYFCVFIFPSTPHSTDLTFYIHGTVSKFFFFFLIRQDDVLREIYDSIRSRKNYNQLWFKGADFKTSVTQKKYLINFSSTSVSKFKSFPTIDDLLECLS